MEETKRFYIFTGKGGVGKSTLALSFTQSLVRNNLNAKYIYFKSNKLDESAPQETELLNTAKSVGIPLVGLDLLECAQEYIAKKLGSKTIASWIVKTPFFRSLINMIPGFNYVIYLGQILQFLEDNPSLILVLDSPSSGHAVTMLEATKNFNQIFESGLVYDDTQKMLNYLHAPGYVKINIITLPSLLAIQEAKELQENILNIHHFDNEIYCNNSLANWKSELLPQILKEKISNEESALASVDKDINATIPLSLKTSSSAVVLDLVQWMDKLR